MAHPAEQTPANDGVMLTEGRRTAPDAPAYLGTNLHCLCPKQPCRSHRALGGDVPMSPARPSLPRGCQGKAGMFPWHLEWQDLACPHGFGKGRTGWCPHGS